MDYESVSKGIVVLGSWNEQLKDIRFIAEFEMRKCLSIVLNWWNYSRFSLWSREGGRLPDSHGSRWR